MTIFSGRFASIYYKLQGVWEGVEQISENGVAGEASAPQVQLEALKG